MASLMTSDEREDFPESDQALNTMIGKMVGFPKHIFCQGCGYGSIAANLSRIFIDEKLEDAKYPFFVGVGCYSAIPTVLPGHSLMILHGRAPAVATGAKLMRPDIKPICIQGDGDALSIGTNHLIHAARRNVDMLVILLHNKIYGMTGGQTAPTTPLEARSTTSPYGVVTNTLDAVELVKACGASYVARWTWAQPRKYMKSIVENLKEHKGFGLVEIVSSCVTYYGRKNDLATPVDLFNWIKSSSISIKDAEKMSASELEGKIVTGIFVHEKDKPDYNAQYDKVLERAGGKK